MVPKASFELGSFPLSFSGAWDKGTFKIKFNPEDLKRTQAIVTCQDIQGKILTDQVTWHLHNLSKKRQISLLNEDADQLFVKIKQMGSTSLFNIHIHMNKSLKKKMAQEKKDSFERKCRVLFEAMNEVPFTTEMTRVDRYINLLHRKGEKIQAIFLKIIKSSMDYPANGTASANAATIWVKAHLSLSGLNLTHVHMPGADLRNMVAEETVFFGAQLQGALLENSCLKNANLKEANLENVSFNRLPYSERLLKIDGKQIFGEKYFVIGTADRLQLMKLKTGSQIREVVFDNKKEIVSLVFSPKGDVIALAESNGEISLRDIPSLRNICNLIGNDRTNKYYSEDNSHEMTQRILKSLITSDYEDLKYTEVVNSELDKFRESHKDVEYIAPALNCLCFSPTGTYIIANGLNALYFWDLDQLQNAKNDIGSIKLSQKIPSENISELFISANEKYLIGFGNDNNTHFLYIWHIEKANTDIQDLFKLELIKQYSAERIIWTRSSQEKDLLVFTTDGNLNILELNDIGGSKETIAQWTLPDPQSINMLQISPDNNLVAIVQTVMKSFTETGLQFSLWNISTGETLYEYELIDAAPFTFAMFPDFSSFVYVDDNGVIKIKNVQTGKGKMLAGHNQRVEDLIISNNGNFLISIDLDNRMCIWNINSLEQEISHFFSAKEDIKFSPNNKSIFCVGPYYFVQKDIGTGQCLSEFRLKETKLYENINEPFFRGMLSYDNRYFINCPLHSRSELSFFWKEITLDIWEIVTNNKFSIFENTNICSINLAENSYYLVAAIVKKENPGELFLVVWDIDKKCMLLEEFLLKLAENKDIEDFEFPEITFSSDNHFFTTFSNKIITLWEIKLEEKKISKEIELPYFFGLINHDFFILYSQLLKWTSLFKLPNQDLGEYCINSSESNEAKSLRPVIIVEVSPDGVFYFARRN